MPTPTPPMTGEAKMEHTAGTPSSPSVEQWAMEPESLARLFHETYERLAPSFGYETRKESRQFDADSPNGRLMIAVCADLARTTSDAARKGMGEKGDIVATGARIIKELLGDQVTLDECLQLVAATDRAKNYRLTAQRDAALLEASSLRDMRERELADALVVQAELDAALADQRALRKLTQAAVRDEARRGWFVADRSLAAIEDANTRRHISAMLVVGEAVTAALTPNTQGTNNG